MSTAIRLVGVGVVSPFGCGRDRFWEALLGDSCAPLLTTVDDGTEGRVQVASVPNLPETTSGERGGIRLPRPTQMGLVAAREAWGDASVAQAGWEADRFGLYAASSCCLLDELCTFEADLAQRAFRAARPSVYQELTLGALTGHVSIALGIQGPIVPLIGGWLSAVDALEFAMADLSEHVVDAALVLSVETIGAPMIDYVRAEAPWLTRLAEGAVALVIARADSCVGHGGYCALARPVRRHAALTAADRSAEGQIDALADAMRGARLDGELDGLFGIGGAGTPLDELECQGLSRAFGAGAADVHVALGAMRVGHAGSSNPLFNLAAATLAARHGELPATARAAAPAYEARVRRRTRGGPLLASGYSPRGRYAALRVSA